MRFGFDGLINIEHSGRGREERGGDDDDDPSSSASSRRLIIPKLVTMHVVVHTSMALFLLLVVNAGGGLDDDGGGSNLAMSCGKADGLNHAFDAILRGKKINGGKVRTMTIMGEGRMLKKTRIASNLRMDQRTL